MSLFDLFRPKKPDVDLESIKDQLQRATEQLTVQQYRLETRHINEQRQGFLLDFAAHYQRAPINIGHLWELQRLSRYFVKRIPESASYIRNMVCYVVGAQPAFTITNGKPNHKSFLNAINRVNELTALLIDAYTNYLEDGEVFIRLIPNGPVPKFVIVNPERIKPPTVENTEEWTFGIKTDPNNWRDIKQYCVYNYNWTSYEIVDKKYIFHLFNNPGHKRGYPTLATAASELLDVEDLRAAGRKGEAARQSIAFIRQHAAATQQDLSNFTSVVEGKRFDNITSDHVPLSIVRAGSIVDVPEGLETVDPPSVKQANSHDLQLQATTYAISAATGAPDWAISGRPFAGSFASSLTAESPFIKKLEFEQGILQGLFKRLLTAAFEVGNNTVLLDTDKMELNITLPDPKTKNLKEEAEANSILYNNKVLSLKTWTGVAGYDFDEEQGNIQSEEPKEVEVRTGDTPDEEEELTN